MDTLIQERRDNPADELPNGGDDGRLPPRPRRRLLTPPSVAVLALASCAIGFYAGVRVEKSHAGSSSTPAAAGFSGALGAGSSTGSSTGGSGSSGSGSAPSAGRSGFAGLAARFGAGGAPGAAGGGSAGTVASVDGRSLVLKETSGNTVKVKLTSATKITKSKSVGRGQIRPGDTIVVSGITDKKGTISAASVSDSGASSSGASSSGGSAGSSSAGSGGSGSAVGSLFSGG
jgi:hypothetical protein